MSEIVLATWPAATGHRFFGVNKDTTLSDCDGYGLQLRVLDKEGCCTLSCLGLYVWFEKAKMNVSARIQDVHSMKLHEAERAIKLLRKLDKALPGNFTTEAPELVLVQAFESLGIKRSIEYHHCQDETFTNVAHAAYKFAAIIAETRKEFK